MFHTVLLVGDDRRPVPVDPGAGLSVGSAQQGTAEADQVAPPTVPGVAQEVALAGLTTDQDIFGVGTPAERLRGARARGATSAEPVIDDASLHSPRDLRDQAPASVAAGITHTATGQAAPRAALAARGRDSDESASGGVVHDSTGELGDGSGGAAENVPRLGACGGHQASARTLRRFKTAACTNRHQHVSRSPACRRSRS